MHTATSAEKGRESLDGDEEDGVRWDDEVYTQPVCFSVEEAAAVTEEAEEEVKDDVYRRAWLSVALEELIIAGVWEFSTVCLKRRVGLLV